ncbi:MAG TPA: heme ABC transporter ATP-binding protein [Chitinophagaceae bacterium]|jgi:iron complex transport system ATP-binding protein|nr:heme ABC transporter ATP-binding protein [Chitinophagaceae bacterium]
MLKTENISFSVGKKQILKNVSASFLPGEFNMILGPNGSGKSTFLKIFSGEINKFQGIVLYDDKKIKELRKEELAKKRAVMSQQADLGFPLLVEEVVLMGRYPHFTFNPNKKDITICNEVIERMNLVEFKERNYLTLSGGEKQRVQYARVLAQVWEKPTDGYRYLFLDEPLNSLDISYQHEFLQSAVELMKEHTVLIAVMHDINLAAHYADNLFFLKEGEMVVHGRPKDILTENIIEQVFNIKTTVIENPVTGKPLVIYN